MIDAVNFHGIILLDLSSLPPLPVREAINDRPTGIVVSTDGGSAMFRRTAPNHAALEVEYRLQGLQVDLAGEDDDSLAEGIEVLCQTEIDLMRTKLSALGKELASQLPAEGKNPVISQESDDTDSRHWSDGGAVFRLRPSEYASTTALEGYEGASDAALVEGTVKATIEHRERSIRKLFDQVLSDARRQRAASANRTGREEPRGGRVGQ